MFAHILHRYTWRERESVRGSQVPTCSWHTFQCSTPWRHREENSSSVLQPACLQHTNSRRSLSVGSDDSKKILAAWADSAPLPPQIHTCQQFYPPPILGMSLGGGGCTSGSFFRENSTRTLASWYCWLDLPLHLKSPNQLSVGTHNWLCAHTHTTLWNFAGEGNVHRATSYVHEIEVAGTVWKCHKASRELGQVATITWTSARPREKSGVAQFFPTSAINVWCTWPRSARRISPSRSTTFPALFSALTASSWVASLKSSPFTDRIASPTYNFSVLSAAIPLNILLMRMGILFSLPPLMLIPRPFASSLATRTTLFCPATDSGRCSGWYASWEPSTRGSDPSAEPLTNAGGSACWSALKVKQSASSVTNIRCHCCLMKISNKPDRPALAILASAQEMESREPRSIHPGKARETERRCVPFNGNESQPNTSQRFMYGVARAHNRQREVERNTFGSRIER